MSPQPLENHGAEGCDLGYQLIDLRLRDQAGIIVVCDIALLAAAIEIVNAFLLLLAQQLEQELEGNPMMSHPSRAIAGGPDDNRGELQSCAVGCREPPIGRYQVYARIGKISVGYPYQTSYLLYGGLLSADPAFTQPFL